MSLPPDLLRHAEKEFGEIESAERLTGGRTNDVWRLVGSGFDVVLKSYQTKNSNSLFPNNPADEAKILNYLYPLGRSPKLIGKWSTGTSSFMAYEFKAGAPTSKTTKEAIQELSRIHNLPPPSFLRHISLSHEVIRRKADDLIETLPKNWREELKDAEPKRNFQINETPSFLHGDPIPQNAIWHASSVTFVDWQCPAVGDPVYDLALALSPAMHIAYGSEPLAAKDEGALLDAYDDAQTVEKFFQIRPMLSWLISAYCAMRAHQGDTLYERAALAELTRIELR